MTVDEINQRMDELAREYGRTLPGDPRRAEIANQLSALSLKLDAMIPNKALTHLGKIL